MKRAANVSVPLKRYNTRSKKANCVIDLIHEVKEKEAIVATVEQNVNLVKFKITKKSQIKKEAKRPHTQVEYDIQPDKTDTDTIANCDIKLLPNHSPIISEENKLGNIGIKNADNWEKIFNNLKEMRKNYDAPVDSMGCHTCTDQNANPKDIRYQTLLALMLSSQTKDQTTHAAMLRLREYGCNVESILNISNEKLGELIFPVSFWKRKVQYIKKSTSILNSQYGNDIPTTVQELCKLPGVGPKMAHLCMQIAWGAVTGIGVDTHVHRISNRLGWVKTKTPEQTRIALQSLFPSKLWIELNQLLVGFGQQICQPVKPRCSICLNNKICPFGINSLKVQI